MTAIAAVACIGHNMWISHFHALVQADQAFHLAYSAWFRAIAMSQMALWKKVLCLWSWPGSYPQAVYLMTTVGNLAWGAGSDADLRTLSPFIVMLIAGSYSLGCQAAGRWTGAAAACMAASDPVLLYTEKRYWLDMPLAALVVDALALLAACRTFSSRGWSCLLGLTLGVGFLTKFTFVWYLAAPILVSAFQGLRNTTPAERVTFGAISLGAAAAFALLAQWSLQSGSFVQSTNDLLPPMSLYLISGCAMTCAVWWWLSVRWLHAPLSHLSSCLCIAALVCAPWILVNLYVLRIRWHEDLENPPKPELWRNVVQCWQLVPWPVQIMAVAGVVAVMLNRQRRAAFGPALLAAACGLGLTHLNLAPFIRYWVPFGVLMAVLAVAWVPEKRYMAAALLAVVIGVSAWRLQPLPSGYTTLPRDADAQQEAHTVAAPESPMDATERSVDYEAAARALLGQLPARSRMVYVVLPSLPDGGPKALFLEGMRILYFMMVAMNAWDNHVLGLGIVRGNNDGFTVLYQDFFAESRTRTLARLSGLSELPYAYPPTNTAVPDAAVISTLTPMAETAARQMFHADYHVAYDWSHRFLLLVRTGI